MYNASNYIVYMHIFPNNKVYIGITCQKPEYRWRNGNGYKPKKPNTSRIYNAIQKYGWDNIKHIILFKDLTLHEANQKESELIKLYDSTNKNKGYNIAYGGDCRTLPQETRKKISNSRKGNNYGYIGEHAPMYGKHHSEKTKQKISQYQSNHNNPFYGKHHSEKTKQKIRENENINCKEILQINKKGEIINKFQSIHQASQITGVNRQGISFCANGKYKTSGGYLWEFV